MEFLPCPACGAFNAGSAEVCAECKSPMDAEPAGATPAITFKAEPEPEPAVEEATFSVVEDEAPEPAAPAAPPFEPPPDVQARIDALEKQIGEKPEARALYLQLAGIYAERGRKDLAAATVQRAIDRDPGNAYLKHKLAQLTGMAEPKVTLPSATAPGMAVVGVARRPEAPTWRQKVDPRHLQIAAAAVVLLLLAVLVKVFVFPGTRLLVSGDFTAHSPVFSPTGQHFAFLLSGKDGSRLAVYDLKQKDYKVVGPSSSWDASGLSWSPDGRQLVYAGGEEDEWGGSLHVYDVASGASKKLAAGRSPSWRSGGTILAVCAPEPVAAPVLVGEDYGYEAAAIADWRPRYCRIDAVTGDVTRTALPAEYDMTPSPLVDSVLFEQWANSGTAAPVAAGAPDQAVQDMADLATAGDSRNLAQASRNLGRELEARQHMEKRKAARTVERLPVEVELYVADVDREQPVRIAAAGEAGFASWTPKGDRILYATNGAAGIEYWTMKPDGTDRQPVLQGVKADPSSVRLSADGKHVFFVAPVASGAASRAMTGESPADLHVAEVGKGKAERIENRHPFKQRFAVSPDGESIVYEVLQDVKLLDGAGRSELWLVKR